MCKIAIVENFHLYSSGIELVLNELEDIQVVVKAKNIDELVQKTDSMIPDVILMDILHSENSGVKPLKKMKRMFPKASVLIITNEDYADRFEEYIRIGVKGFIFSDADSEELKKAIKKLNNGDEYFPKNVWNILKNVIQSGKKTSKKNDGLTDREINVLKLFTQGLTYKEIGLKLNISPRTVETHKKNILSKLKIKSTAAMIKYAFQNNMVV